MSRLSRFSLVPNTTCQQRHSLHLPCHMNFGHHLSAGGMAVAAVSRSLAHLHSWRTTGALREGTDWSAKRMGIKKTHTKTTRIHRLAEGMRIREGRNRSAERKSVSFHALMRSVLPALLSENRQRARVWIRIIWIQMLCRSIGHVSHLTAVVQKNPNLIRACMCVIPPFEGSVDFRKRRNTSGQTRC
jgi:hypothetical protein